MVITFDDFEKLGAAIVIAVLIHSLQKKNKGAGYNNFCCFRKDLLPLSDLLGMRHNNIESMA